MSQSISVDAWLKSIDNAVSACSKEFYTAWTKGGLVDADVIPIVTKYLDSNSGIRQEFVGTIIHTVWEEAQLGVGYDRSSSTFNNILPQVHLLVEADFMIAILSKVVLPAVKQLKYKGSIRVNEITAILKYCRKEYHKACAKYIKCMHYLNKQGSGIVGCSLAEINWVKDFGDKFGNKMGAFCDEYNSLQEEEQGYRDDVMVKSETKVADYVSAPFMTLAANSTIRAILYAITNCDTAALKFLVKYRCIRMADLADASVKNVLDANKDNVYVRIITDSIDVLRKYEEEKKDTFDLSLFEETETQEGSDSMDVNDMLKNGTVGDMLNNMNAQSQMTTNDNAMRYGDNEMLKNGTVGDMVNNINAKSQMSNSGIGSAPINGMGPQSEMWQETARQQDDQVYQMGVQALVNNYNLVENTINIWIHQLQQFQGELGKHRTMLEIPTDNRDLAGRLEIYANLVEAIGGYERKIANSVDSMRNSIDAFKMNYIDDNSVNSIKELNSLMSSLNGR